MFWIIRKRLKTILITLVLVLLFTMFIKQNDFPKKTVNYNIPNFDLSNGSYCCFNRSLNNLKLHAYVRSVNYEQIPETYLEGDQKYFLAKGILKTSYLSRMIIKPRTSSKKCPFLVVLIPSVIEHTSIRNLIRITWGRVSFGKTWPHAAMNAGVRFVFMFGRGNNLTLDRQLQEESDKYGDILQEDFLDSYRNLTIKILMGHKWVLSHCPCVKFVLKADEDTFVNIPLLVDFLMQRQDTFQMSAIGYTYRTRENSAPVYRTGRWAVSEDLYPMKYYPNYAAGNTYVMSGDLIRSALYICQFIPIIPIEDAYITGILRKVVHGKLFHVSDFTSFNSRTPNSCSFIKNSRISVTKVTTEITKQIWKAIERNEC